MKKCRWCGKLGDWPAVCMSSRDMEEKSYDARCRQALMEVGGGEFTVNRIEAESLQSLPFKRSAKA